MASLGHASSSNLGQLANWHHLTKFVGGLFVNQLYLARFTKSMILTQLQLANFSELSFSLSFDQLKLCDMHISSKPQSNPYKRNQRIYMFACIAHGWLSVVMLLHKEIERLKINTYSFFPHFPLALVIFMRAFACSGGTTW